MKIKRKLQQIIVYTVLGLFSVAILYPLFWIGINSLKTNNEFYKNTFSLPGSLKWNNYVAAWKEGVGAYYLNSILVTGISVIAILLVSTMTAYLITRFEFKCKKIIIAFLIGGMFVSPQTAIIPLYNLLHGMRLYNTYFSMIIPIVAFRLSFSFFMLYPAFKEFPKELEEAAELDGCGKLRVYWSVLIPVCKPAVIAVALLNLVYAWNEFTFSINFVSDECFYTIPIGIMSFSQALYTNWVVLLAGIVLSIIPVLIVFIAFQKYFVTGLTAGSVKE